jgi:hypothetical protein
VGTVSGLFIVTVMGLGVSGYLQGRRFPKSFNQICGLVTGFLMEGKPKVSNTTVTDFVNYVARDICRRCSLDSKRSLFYKYV